MEKSDLAENCWEELRKKMGLEKGCGLNVKRDNEGLGLGFVRYTRSMSGKRIALSSNMEVDSTVTTPRMKKPRSEKMLSFDKSLLEALPQDILIRILCNVDHDDLKQLFHVSKPIREAVIFDCFRFFSFCLVVVIIDCDLCLFCELTDFNCETMAFCIYHAHNKFSFSEFYCFGRCWRH
ncbi:hypothetical protein CsSME_00007496 [Camellia sinensis var. sinensis]